MDAKPKLVPSSTSTARGRPPHGVHWYHCDNVGRTDHDYRISRERRGDRISRRSGVLAVNMTTTR